MNAAADARASAPADPARESADKLSLAYVISHYPKLTETFIVDEVQAISRDFDISIVPIVPGDTAGYDADTILDDRIVKEHYLGMTVLRDAARELVTSPRSLLLPAGTFIRHAARKPRVALKSLLLVPKIMALAYRFRKSPVQHLHAGFANHPTTVAWMVAKLGNLPFSFVAHANDIFKYDYLLDDKVGDAAAVFAISRFNRDYLLKSCPRAVAERIHVLPTGVDCERHAYRERARSGKVFELLSVGSLLEKKGHAYLIEAVAALRRAGHEVHCRIVGGGPLHAELARLIQSLEVDDAVELCGPRDRAQVSDYLDQADAFVLACVEPRDRGADGIPVALMEAMATGLPVISTRFKAIPELVVDGVSGILAEPADTDGIVAGVARLIEDDAYRNTLARGGRAWVEEHFDQASIATTRAGIIERAVAERGVPAGVHEDH